MPWYVGNDLVDLTEKENEDRPKNVRFVNRVLTEKERRLLNESADKVTTFALLWSGKEAAYKVLKKIDSSIFFSHSQFVVTIKKCQTGGHEGHVFYKGYQIPVSWETDPKWVHCLAHYGTTSEPSFFDWRLDSIDSFSPDTMNFTPQEKCSIHSLPSSFVRMQAKNMLQNEGEHYIELIRPSVGKKFGPPQIWQGGIQLKKWDISLSHDGFYVASTLIRE